MAHGYGAGAERIQFNTTKVVECHPHSTAQQVQLVHGKYATWYLATNSIKLTCNSSKKAEYHSFTCAHCVRVEREDISKVRQSIPDPALCTKMQKWSRLGSLLKPQRRLVSLFLNRRDNTERSCVMTCESDFCRPPTEQSVISTHVRLLRRS